MSDANILTDPLRMQTDLRGTSASQVVLPAGVWTPLAGTDPMRQALYLLPFGSVSDLWVSPVPGVGVPVAAPLPDTAVRVIHSAVYLSLTGGAWYGYSVAGQTVYVWDITRQ